MSVLLRIYEKIELLERKGSHHEVADFLMKHLGKTDTKSFREFYNHYENWRIKRSNHSQQMQQQFDKKVDAWRKAFGASPKVS